MEKSTRARGSRTVVAVTTAFVAAVYTAVLLSGSGVASPSTPSAANQYPAPKVTICHHARSRKGVRHVTIRVNRNALRGHQRHGDTLGRCTSAKNKKIHRNNKTHARKFHRRLGR